MKVRDTKSMKRIFLSKLLIIILLTFTSCDPNVASLSDLSTITEFSVYEAGIISETDHTISITVPFNTDITGLSPQIIHTGNSISPESETSVNFTNPVTYTVTAEDGTKQEYIVTITISPNDILDTIKIGSFNMQILGNTKLSRANTLATLADIATQYDILAMQEVGSNWSNASYETCEAIMDTYIDKVNEIFGSSAYSYVHGDQYAFVYRNDKVILNSSQLYSGSQTFKYVPLVANFELYEGNFDFSMITIHTSPSIAETEIPALKTAITEIVTLYSEDDVICIGDFNADGDYYEEGTGTDLSGYDDYITGIPNSADTTVADSDNTYDRIQMTNSMSSDFSTSWGVLKFSDHYDVSICEGSATKVGTEGALSDHYPVWAEFHTNLDND